MVPKWLGSLLHCSTLGGPSLGPPCKHISFAATSGSAIACIFGCSTILSQVKPSITPRTTNALPQHPGCCYAEHNPTHHQPPATTPRMLLHPALVCTHPSRAFSAGTSTYPRAPRGTRWCSSSSVTSPQSRDGSRASADSAAGSRHQARGSGSLSRECGR